LKQFRKEFTGKLWVEIMLVKGLNDSEMVLGEIATLLSEINPDEVHILQPTRPPVETWVEPTDKEGLERARKILGQTARVIDPFKGYFDLGEEKELLETIVEIITRHPMKENEIIAALEAYPLVDVKAALQQLEESGKIQVVVRFGIRYWSKSSSYYPG